jgi:hypothetical protein
VVDDSPELPGLQLSLDAGDARLFILPEHAEWTRPEPAV